MKPGPSATASLASGATTAHTVDARGLACPLPIIALARALRAAPVGTEVTLLATDPAMDPDVRAFCASTGHVLLEVGVSADHRIARVRKEVQVEAKMSGSSGPGGSGR